MQTTKTEKNLSGYTMPGSFISIACLGLAVAGACFLFPKQGNLNAAVACPSMTTSDQNAYAVLSQDIRAANAVENFQPDQLVLAAGQGQVTYAFNKTSHTLTRTSGDDSRVLLTGVESFSFSLLQRAPAGAPLGSLAQANVNNAKAVACRWSCSRNLAGAKLDSETFQMAPVLMRNH